MKSLLLSVILLLLPMMSIQAQTFTVKDGDTISIKISSREVTRITIEGDAKLTGIRSSNNRLVIQSDDNGKEVFIQPQKTAPATFSFFVSDSNESTYTIVATQHDIPSETIVLRTIKKVNNKAFQKYYQSMPHVQQVKNLVRSMALNKPLNGYEYSGVQKEVPLWKEAKITFLDAWHGLHLIGERYLLKNISSDELRLQESEFSSFGQHVLAVAIEKMTLASDESTCFYIVRGSEDK